MDYVACVLFYEEPGRYGSDGLRPRWRGHKYTGFSCGAWFRNGTGTGTRHHKIGGRKARSIQVMNACAYRCLRKRAVASLAFSMPFSALPDDLHRMLCCLRQMSYMHLFRVPAPRLPNDQRVLRAGDKPNTVRLLPWFLPRPGVSATNGVSRQYNFRKREESFHTG